MKQLMSGNEATALGLWEAGVKVGSAYPGTPSTEIFENLPKYKDVYCEWAPNEKVAKNRKYTRRTADKRRRLRNERMDCRIRRRAKRRIRVRDSDSVKPRV